MESRRITAGAIVAAVALVFILFSSAFGCRRDEFGECREPRAVVRIGLIGGGKGNATLILEAKMRLLQADLREFVTRAAITASSWRTRGLTDLDLLPPSRGVNTASRANPPLALSKMPDMELARAETELHALDAPAHLRVAWRVQAVSRELARRKQDRLTALIAQFKQLSTPLKPARKPAPKPAPAPLHVPAPVIPGSPDPYNAPAPSGQTVYIAPMTSVWYSVSDRGRRLTMWMDANHQTGLTMAIYGADQQDVWNAKPVGKAAPGEGHDFFWTGRSRFKGNWRVRITNTNDFSVPYTLTATAVSDKNGDLCRDCHGVIEDEWERCEHEGSFCEDLKEEFAN